MNVSQSVFVQQLFIIGLFAVTFLCSFPVLSLAATLAVTPGTAVFKTGQTFTVNVLVNTAGAPVNAADGTVSFNPSELSVIAVSRASSIFNLWTSEPAFSNAAGTVTFSGGVPTGYTGAGGVVMSITFKSNTSGTARVSIATASVLAADGRGTNVLTGMSGGTYTLAAVTSQPAPEVIVEYVAPANTPTAPKITSETHSDPTIWHSNKNAVLSWVLPANVNAVRTSLDSAAVSVPTKVYDTPIKTITLNDLDQGVSYFHVQFKNADGWGKVTHYRLAIDSEKPTAFTIALPPNADLSQPVQTVSIKAVDATSPILKFKVQVDATLPYEYVATSSDTQISLPSLEPGSHNVVIEAFDAAGNSLISTLTLTIVAFDKPYFTEYPPELTAGVIPVMKGTTRPHSIVAITLTSPSGEVIQATTSSSDTGEFIFVPSSAFVSGVYSLFATAIDQHGAASNPSDTIKILVQKPGYMVIGSFLINVLSVVIPLIALCILGWLVVAYGYRRMLVLRQGIIRESGEATAMAEHEFAAIRAVLDRHAEALIASRKTGKLTAAETALIKEVRSVVAEAEARVEKEVADVAAIAGSR